MNKGGLKIGFVDHYPTHAGLRRFADMLIHFLVQACPSCEIRYIAPGHLLRDDASDDLHRSFATQGLVTDEVLHRIFPRRVFQAVPGAKQIKAILWKALSKSIYRFDKQINSALKGVDVAYFPHTLFIDYFECAVPVVITLHDMIWKYINVFPADEQRRIDANLPLWLKGSQVVITGSDFMRKEIERFYPQYAKRIEVIPYATPILPAAKQGADRNLLLAHWNIASSFIYCPTNILPHKNIENLIYALAYLKRNHVDVSLVCTGQFTNQVFGVARGAALTKRVPRNWHTRVMNLRKLALAEGLRLNQDIIGLGYVSDVELATLYSAASCVVMPALIEAGSLPLQEAAAHRAPIACSDIPVYHEQAERHGMQPRYFDPRNPKSIAAAIQELIQSRPSNQELDQVAHRVRTLTWESTAGAYLRIFESVV